jgi:purine-nucleoside phosphorylase
MKPLLSRIQETTRFIRKKTNAKPKVAVVLGTGLGQISGRVVKKAVLPYDTIPDFPRTTVESHAGRLLFGTLKGKEILVMEGRFHFYEGYSLDEITFPIRVMKALGVEVVILSSAAGGMNPDYRKGDLVVVSDHINFMGVNPLIGPNDPRLGIRFPDMIEPYSKRLIELAKKVAKKKDITLHEGVYIGVTGPNLETPAEYKLMRLIGADVVGMSTVPEVIVGVHAKLELLAISVVTDMCLPESLVPVSIEEVIRTAQEASPRLDRLIEGIVENL